MSKTEISKKLQPLKFRKVLVTGGAGYKGCILVPKLLAKGYEVVVYDLMITYDRGLPKHPKLTVIKGDIRDTNSFRKAVEGCDAVIHMACISNDPSFELDPDLSKTINYECFEQFCLWSERCAGCNRGTSLGSFNRLQQIQRPLRAHPF